VLEIRTGRSLQKWRRADSPDVLVRCHPSRVGENSFLADSESRACKRTRTRSHAHATCHLTKVDILLGHPSALLTTFRQELALVRLQVGDQSRLFPVCSPLPFLRSPHGRLAILNQSLPSQDEAPMLPHESPFNFGVLPSSKRLPTRSISNNCR